jgi:hypothetical protein
MVAVTAQKMNYCKAPAGEPQLTMAAQPWSQVVL